MEHIFWEHDKMPDEKPGIKTVHKQTKRKMKTKTKKGKKKGY